MTTPVSSPMHISSSCSVEKCGWHSLSADLHERILLLLPVSAAVKASVVCKQWLAIISSPSFSARLTTGRQPWLFIWGINELIHTRSAAFAFDPVAAQWFRLCVVRPPDFNRTSLSSANGVFFAFSGSKVCFTPTPTKFKWRETSPANFARCFALMGTIGSPQSASFKFVTVGNIYEDDHRIAEVYDSQNDTWECCDSLQDNEFVDGISSQWISSAVLGRKFYIADYAGYIAHFDVDTKLWSKVDMLRVPDDLVSLFLIAGDATLYVLVVSRSLEGECVKLFQVNDSTADLLEVSKMPRPLFSLFESDNDLAASLKCVGFGTLFYVYSEQYYKGYPVCVCELKGGSYEWRQLPSLPRRPRFDRVVCCSATISPRACLESI